MADGWTDDRTSDGIIINAFKIAFIKCDVLNYSIKQLLLRYSECIINRINDLVKSAVL